MMDFFLTLFRFECEKVTAPERSLLVVIGYKHSSVAMNYTVEFFTLLDILTIHPKLQMEEK